MDYIYMDFEYISDSWGLKPNQRKYSDLVQIGYYIDDEHCGEFLVKPHHHVVKSITEHLGFTDKSFVDAIDITTAFEKMKELSNGRTVVVFGDNDVTTLELNNKLYCDNSELNQVFLFNVKQFVDNHGLSLNDWAYVIKFNERSEHTAMLDAKILAKVHRKYEHLTDNEKIRLKEIKNYARFKREVGALRKYFQNATDKDRDINNIEQLLDMFKYFDYAYPKFEDFKEYCKNNDTKYLEEKTSIKYI